MSISKDFVGVLQASKEKGTKPYDTQATVTRVEGSTVWVHIPGGVDETPVKKTVSAKEGDIVQVRIANGSAYLMGNASSPPTDNTEAFKARDTAIEAKDVAERSEETAKRAQDAADSAEKAAGRAWEKAGEAEEAAGEAKDSARSANEAAKGALTQLSVVEDVVGTLSWISEHGTYEKTGDTHVLPGKHYFSKEGDRYNLIVNPSGDPSSEGYFELSAIDEAVTNYVKTHLALTDQGLWVVNDSKSYKILLAADGMKVYDYLGNLVASFGESISFSSSRPQYIGGEDAYIIFYDSNGDGQPDAINIGGSKVTIMGDKKLSDLLTSLDISAKQTDSGTEISIGDKKVELKDGQDAVLLRIDSSRGNVFKNSNVETVLTVHIIKAGETISTASRMREVFGSSAKLTWLWKKIDEDAFHIILSTDSMISNEGFTLTLTPDKVDTKVTFQCELDY